MRMLWVLAALVVAIGGCTRPNPNVCCTSAEDCAELGVTDQRPCGPGLVCIEHQCEVPAAPECATTGCGASAPVCVLETGECAGCVDSSSCERFSDALHCDSSSGSCVGCLTDSHCTGTTPICESGACRACSRDDDCATGACGLDGACVPSDAILYLSPTGSDAAPCTNASPCKTIASGALPRTTATRNHIVLSPGTYNEGDIYISAGDTSASELVIHGGGSNLTGNSSESLLNISVPVTLRDLHITYSGTALLLSRTSLVERVHITASNGITVGSQVTMRDVEIDTTYQGIVLQRGHLVLDRAVIRGGEHAVVAFDDATVEISNLLAHGQTLVALDLPTTSGTIQFSTIANSGSNSSTNPRGVRCSSGLTLRSSIVWTPAGTPIAGGCTMIDVIAGPTAVPGASNANPMFVNGYHIGANSPARDAVDVGPALDYEGEPRPRGVRFDIGADETD